MGTDGKLYKVDLKNSNQENFLTGFHSQVSKTGYDNTSSSTIKKGRIITGTINRPNSSKSNIRPSSAHSKCL